MRGASVPTDFEAIDNKSLTFIDDIHRTTSGADIYFLVNQNDRTEQF